MAPSEIKSYAAFDSKQRFETLLNEISTFFINLPPDRIDDEIEIAQQRVCEFLELDRSTLFMASEEEFQLQLTHVSQPQGSRKPPEQMGALDFFPWTTQKALSGETVIISKLTDLPPEAGPDLVNYKLFSTRSAVVVPLSVEIGQVIGLLTFAVLKQEREWTGIDVQRFKAVAQIFANALARKQADLDLRESEARLSLVMDVAGAGLWIMDHDTGDTWVTPKTRELFHFTPHEKLNYDSFFRVIHPDDHDQIHRDVQNALRSGGDLRCEYRILLPDGSPRWIEAFGKRHSGSGKKMMHLMGVSMDITERKQAEQRLREYLHEIEELKQRLEKENIYLKQEVKLLLEHKEIVGQSLVMKKVLSLSEQVAQTESTVIIQGETGTGKGLLARTIHGMSSRKDRPLVTVNCAALPPSLIESELFGREKGAYTGALTRMAGRFEIADGATLFLDEVGELPHEVQSKLLQVLEQGRFERLGSTRPQNVDVRIIAATNRDLAQDVREGKFRKDLYYRLNVFPVLIPPLREREEDIPLMVWSFVKEFQKKMGKNIESIPKKTLEALQSYHWPGNVRELRNAIEHAMILNQDKTLVIRTPGLVSIEPQASPRLEDVERRHIISILNRTDWRVAGKGGAAEVLDLRRTTLYSKMKKLNIHRPPGR